MIDGAQSCLLLPGCQCACGESPLDSTAVQSQDPKRHPICPAATNKRKAIVLRANPIHCFTGADTHCKLTICLGVETISQALQHLRMCSNVGRCGAAESS